MCEVCVCVCEVIVCVVGGGGRTEEEEEAEEEARVYRIKKKNPTQSCGEQKTHTSMWGKKS